MSSHAVGTLHAAPAYNFFVCISSFHCLSSGRLSARRDAPLVRVKYICISVCMRVPSQLYLCSSPED